MIEKGMSEGGRMTAPLGTKTTRLIVAAELYARAHGHSPTWTELAAATGISRSTIYHLLPALRQQGLVTYEDDTPRSLLVTEAGLQAAIRATRKRDAA